MYRPPWKHNIKTFGVQWNPSCKATSLTTEMWHFKRGSLSSGVEISFHVQINNNDKWPLQRSWFLGLVAF